MSEGTSGKLNLENLNFLMDLKRVGSSQVKDLTVPGKGKVDNYKGSEEFQVNHINAALPSLP